MRLGIDFPYGCSKVRHMNHHNARISNHAKEQAAAKGWSLRDVWLAHVDPDITYASGKYAGQVRCIRGNLVAIVDEARNICVTVYANVVETDLRPDQIARGDKISA